MSPSVAPTLLELIRTGVPDTVEPARPDSMTDRELDSDIKIFNVQKTRLVRIARGSGCTLRQVEELMQTFKPFQRLASKMKGMNKGGKMANMAGPAGMRNLAGMFDPRMIQQMGGMGNIQKMMQQFGAGGMPPGFGGMM